MLTPEARLCAALAPYLKQGVCLAFSGGCDSALLLAVLAEEKKKQDFPLSAAMIAGPFQTEPEKAEARQTAEQWGVDLVFPDVPDLLSLPQILNNERDRCYHCKKMMFQTLCNFAEHAQIQTVMDGTNADDLKVYRPGRQALLELGVISPLAEAGLSKTEVRSLAAEMGLSTATKPASACLATRFPYGTRLLPERLQSVGRAEQRLREMGFGQLRVRCHGTAARLELELDQPGVSDLFQHREQAIREALAAEGFDTVLLDPAGFRSGSFDTDVTTRGSQKDK